MNTSEMTLPDLMEKRLEMLLLKEPGTPDLNYRNESVNKDAALFVSLEMIIKVGGQLSVLLENFENENGSLTEDLLRGAQRISTACSTLSYERALNSDFEHLEEVMKTCVQELATPSQGELLRVHDATELWLQTQNCFLQIQSFYEKHVNN